MATKKECDRCGKQWVPEPDRSYDDGPGDRELCLIQVNLPSNNQYNNRAEIHKSYELCQACGRHIVEQLKPPPKAG